MPSWKTIFGASTASFRKTALQQHIFAQLKYELLNCKAAFRLCGMTGAPRGFQKSDIISLDIVSENSELHEQLLAA